MDMDSLVTGQRKYCDNKVVIFANYRYLCSDKTYRSLHGTHFVYVLDCYWIWTCGPKKDDTPEKGKKLLLC